MRVSGVLAFFASVVLGTSLVRGLRHFDLKVMRTPTGYETVYPGPGPFQVLDDSTLSPGRRIIDWDTEYNHWSINHPSDLEARLRDISYNGDVCHREFTIPMVGRTFASTTFIPLEETQRSRTRAHSWAIAVSLGAFAATPLLLWGVAAVIWVLATSRQKRGHA